MTTAVATLSSHTNSDEVTRKQLKLLPPPEKISSTFRSVRHIELVEGLESSLKDHKLGIVEEKLALRRDGAMLFGIMKIKGLDTTDGTGALGFRTANTGKMSIQMVAGLSVFVCDNLCFRGDLIALKRKHTSGLVLEEELAGGVDRFVIHFNRLTREIDGLKDRVLEDATAKAMIHDVFVNEVMPIRFLPVVSKHYFEPPHPEFEPRTAWSLHNAFTETAKDMPVSTRMKATAGLGVFFGMVNGDPTGETFNE